MCIDAQSNLIDDQSLTTYAYALAKEGRYEEALPTLDLLKNPNTAEALNYRGYATRKLGRTDEGIGYYLQAVALDPDYTLVREYLGEAYLVKGDIAARQGAARRDREALRHDLRALRRTRRGDRRRELTWRPALPRRARKD